MMESIDVEALLASAGEHIFQGDLQGARLILEGSIQKESSDPRLKSLLAHVYSKLDMHTEALHIYDQLLRQFPREGSLHFRRGLELIHTGDLPKAIASLQKACRLNPAEKQWRKFLHHIRALMGFESIPEEKPDFPPEWLHAAERLAEMQSSATPAQQSSGHIRYQPEELVAPEPDGGWLDVALKRGFYVRGDALHVSSGEMRFLPAENTDASARNAMTGNFLRCMGKGRILLDPGPSSRLLSIKLYEARLLVFATHLLAFPSDMSWEPGTLHSSEKELELFSFRGSGDIYLSVPKTGLMELSLHEAKRTIIVPQDRVAAWYGRLLAQFRDNSLLHISGEGTVLIKR